MYGNRQAATKEGPTATCQLSICHIEMYRSNRADYTKHFQISWNGKYTYIWEYSMLNTCWSWENYRPTTVYYMKNASLDIFLLSKHPQWKKKMHLHSSPGLLFYILGQAASSGRGKGGNTYGGGPMTPLEKIWPRYTCGLLPPAFSWEAKINQNSGCKDYWPGQCPYIALMLTFPERSWDAFYMDFLCKAMPKEGRHISIFFPLLI